MKKNNLFAGCMQNMATIALAALVAIGIAACNNEPEASKESSELTGSVTIPNNIRIGDTVEANTSALGGKGTINYQWQTSSTANGPFTNLSGITENPYFVLPSDRVSAGRFLRVRVTRDLSQGYINSNAAELTAAPELSGSVSIPETIALGATVTADTANLSGTNAISYQWELSDSEDGTYTGIMGATEKSFTVQGFSVTVGSFLRVTVTRLANPGSISSNAVKIAPENSPPSGSVTIPVNIALGDAVGANTSALGGIGTISYQWQIGSSATGVFSDIPEATSRIFIVEGTGIAAGIFLRVTVTRSGNVGSVLSNAVEISAVHPRAFIDFSGYTGAINLETHQPPEAQTGDFTLGNGINGSGLRLSNDGEGEDTGLTISSQYGGAMASRTGNGSGFQYFFIDNPAVKAAKTVTLYLTYFDNSSNNIGLQYRRQGDTTDDRFYRINIRRTNSGTFVTTQVELELCDFMAVEQQNQGAQFRFPGGVPIQRVEIVSGGMPDPVEAPPPDFATPTPLNNLIGKGVTGYQAWFRADGSSWHHWQSSSGAPAPGNVTVEIWPAGFEDYRANGASLRDTGFTMPDGNTAQLFNSRDRNIIRTQIKWMQEAGIDGAAPQRFYGDGVGGSTFATDTGDSPTHLTMIRDAAEEFGRIFYVMYDMTGTGSRNQETVLRQMRLDWIYNVENKGLLNSPNYAQADGKPVVCIWGIHAIESTDSNRYPKIETTIQLIQWFRNRGYYVIGGIPDDEFWTRSGRGREMYSLIDMISPWYIGRDVHSQILAGRLSSGMDFCRENLRSWAYNTPIEFMPTVWPGFAWTNMSGNSGVPNSMPRNAGQHIWTQIREYLNRDTTNTIRSIYLAMFDEYDEGTNWMKAGVDYFDIPLSQYFQTLSADGIWLSSDYYMRMAKVSIEAFKRKITAGGGSAVAGAPGNTGPLNEYSNNSSIIVEHSEGPVYWRNSFERRNGRIKYGAMEGSPDRPNVVPVEHLQIDVGVPNGGLTGTPQNVTVTGVFTVNREQIPYHATTDNYTPPSTTLGMVYTSEAKSGGSAFRLAGTRTAGSGAAYLYRIAGTRIKAGSGMALSYWQKAEDPLGGNVSVDLRLSNGTYLSSAATVQDTGTPVNGWQQKTVNIPTAWNGSYITEVIVAYRDSGTTTGNFAALIDDIIIKR